MLCSAVAQAKVCSLHPLHHTSCPSYRLLSPPVAMPHLAKQSYFLACRCRDLDQGGRSKNPDFLMVDRLIVDGRWNDGGCSTSLDHCLLPLQSDLVWSHLLMGLDLLVNNMPCSLHDIFLGVFSSHDTFHPFPCHSGMYQENSNLSFPQYCQFYISSTGPVTTLKSQYPGFIATLQGISKGWNESNAPKCTEMAPQDQGTMRFRPQFHSHLSPAVTSKGSTVPRDEDPRA